MKWLAILFFITIIFSECNEPSNKDVEIEKLYLMGKTNIVRLNDVLFKDTVTKEVFYNLYHNCYEEGNVYLTQIIDKNGSVFNNVDLATFKNMGSFWIDKNFYYNIYEDFETRNITAYKHETSDITYHYKNSKYKIINGKLICYNWHELQGDTVIDCSRDINELININDFHVLDQNFDNSEFIKYKNCYTNAFAIYQNKFLFFGCWLNIEKVGPKLKKELLMLKKNKIFVKPIIVKKGVIQ